ncbi:neuromedin-U receptor 2, partial [Biomphalaria glabrata]
AVKIIITIWTVSVGVALPYAVHTRIYYGVVIPGTDIPVPDSLICSIPQHFLSGFMYYMFQVSTFLFFIGPVTLIVILYIMIGIALRRSPLSRASSDEKRYSSMHSSSSLPHQPRRVVIRMLVAVTAAFIICWAPFHTQRLMILYVSLWTPHMLAVQSHIFYISGVLYFVSSTVNPILYNVISKRYRAAFKQ